MLSRGLAYLVQIMHISYRKNRSTEDQLALIAQERENPFQEQKKVVAVFFDLTKTFDKVWREGLLLKVLQSRVQMDPLLSTRQISKSQTTGLKKLSQ